MNKKKRTIIVVCVIISVLILSTLLVFLLSFKSYKEDEETTTTTTSTTNINRLFKGYRKFDINYDSPLTYDIEKQYQFVYGDMDKKSLNISYDDLQFTYDVTASENKLTFVEHRYNKVIKGYEGTGKIYTYATENKITSFIIIKDDSSFSDYIAILDSKNNVYLYETEEEETTIERVLSKLKKIKTISKVKRIGYYTLNNDPYVETPEYDMIYEDIKGDIRYLLGKNPLFFQNAFYRFIGADFQNQIVYVLKDGRMKFGTGNKENYLYDGEYAIYYRGSFHQILNNDTREDLYIIGVDGYLYNIENMQENSKVLLSKKHASKIKAIGVQVIKNEEDYATEESRIIIQFEDDTTLKFDSIFDFSLLGVE